MKVYVVTSGSYSDYTINAVFLDKEKAKKYADVRYNSNDIEEYETMDDNIETMIMNEISHSEKFKDVVDVYMLDDNEPKVKFGYMEFARHTYINKYGHDNIWYIKQVDYSCSEHNKIKEKAIKAAYDLRAYILYLKAEGYTEEKINEIINDKED